MNWENFIIWISGFQRGDELCLLDIAIISFVKLCTGKRNCLKTEKLPFHMGSSSNWGNNGTQTLSLQPWNTKYFFVGMTFMIFFSPQSDETNALTYLKKTLHHPTLEKGAEAVSISTKNSCVPLLLVNIALVPSICLVFFFFVVAPSHQIFAGLPSQLLWIWSDLSEKVGIKGHHGNKNNTVNV